MKAGHFNRPINRQIHYNMTTEIEIMTKRITRILEADQARVDTSWDLEKRYRELKFSIECLLDSKVSEGRKKD
tara:strand:+ start:124 stop:342 length:219 start_codon:yes stop_codon:yes gene_type:complete